MFTLFDDAQTDRWIAATSSPVMFPPDVIFCVCQVERAPDTGRIHIQGYLQLKNPKALSGIWFWYIILI